MILSDDIKMADTENDEPKLQLELEGAGSGPPPNRPTRVGTGGTDDADDRIPASTANMPRERQNAAVRQRPDIDIRGLSDDETLEQLRRISWEIYPQYFANWIKLEKVLPTLDEVDQIEMKTRYESINQLTDCYRSIEAWGA